MCGIVGVVSRRDPRPVPDLLPEVECAETAVSSLAAWQPDGPDAVGALQSITEAVEAFLHALRGYVGLRALDEDGSRVRALAGRLQAAFATGEQALERGAGVGDLERVNALLLRLKDAHFTLERDRLANWTKVRDLAPGATTESHRQAAYDLNVALNALDRLEVRGRDSAGVHVYVRGALATLPPEVDALAAMREGSDPFTNGSVRRVRLADGSLVFSFVYKVAAEVGELGDNVRILRADLAGDELLHLLLELPGVSADVLGHTRWASVGVVSEANAHPLNEEELDEEGRPCVVAALNGDVDNYERLIREEELRLAPEITTDAKVIPALVSRQLEREADPSHAFRKVVQRLEGSVAIAAAVADAPGQLFLALRGSGQALYVGLADGAFLVASEPYGIVEEAREYLRLDGETPADPSRPESRGQVVVLDGARAGEWAGIRRMAYDGTELPLRDADRKRLEITTRDVDRGDHPHYLRKELDESPESVRKTLRGRVVQDGDDWRVCLGEDSLPAAIRTLLAGGAIRRIRVIGQGTAAVAGQGVAALIADALRAAAIDVDATPATEVSGFQLSDDMSRDLYIAISQSGTTTDTNRTVDLLRSRGAAVIGIVNRRNSDLTERVDGVIYTSDGRDVEMAVASTKAFYAQITAGALLAEALAEACGVSQPDRRRRVLGDLMALPTRMREVLAAEEAVAEAARAHAPSRRHWALVGNGRNRVAASEIRIKLSELCYKSIACDFTEDKKHIDLSSEPLILVCAAGVDRGNAIDVGKEIEIYAAHKACPIVIASEGDQTWSGAASVLRVPDVGPDLAFVMTTMVGHLFGYHAAMAIDKLAVPLREARGAIDAVVSEGDGMDLRARLRARLTEVFRRFRKGLGSGRYDGALEASTASRLGLSFRYATGLMPLDFFPDDFNRRGTPAAAVDVLLEALSDGIEELTRPVDAIKHQAKTVTVGISRGEETLMAVPLVREVMVTGVAARHLAYADLRVLQALDPAVAEVVGWTRYAIRQGRKGSTIHVANRGGISEGLPSRTDADPRLRGTKNTVASERQLIMAVGRSDGRPILLVPESQGGTCTGLILLHVRVREDLESPAIRSVLSGYRDRYARVRDAVTETGATLREEDLVRIGLLDLLTQPVLVVADRVAALTPSP